MSNFVRYQNQLRSLAKEGLREKISCGTYGAAELHSSGGHRMPGHHTVWIPDGVEITTSISIDVVNGQPVASPKEDDCVYFWVSGARGPGHNWHKKLLVPSGVEMLAAGGKAAHQPGWCNKITSVLFRVPKGTERVVMGDIYGEDSETIVFTCADGDWTVMVEPLDRFRALNPDWPGLWTKEDEGDKPSLPLPAHME